MMEKPISIRVQEFKENLVNTINNSGLIPIIVEPIIKDLYEQVVVQKDKQYEQDKLEYEKSLEKEEKDGE